MKTESEIQQDVMDELKWEAIIKATEIGVAVKGGDVTLTGTVDTYAKKLAAENAAMRVKGVKAVANDIEVKISSLFERNDTDIAAAALNSIKWNSSVDEDKIKVKVEKGWVTLEGEVEWKFQQSKVKKLVEDLIGVKGVTNLIRVVPKTPTPSEVKSKIRAAFLRNVHLGADNIKVEVSGNKVTLTGEVHSLAEKNDAENAAWSAPGVTEVDNKLEVTYSEAFA